MKTLSCFLSLAFIAIFFFASCKNVDNNLTPHPEPTNTWPWQGIAPFSMQDGSAVFPADTASISVIKSFNYINIVIHDSTGNIAIGLFITENAKAGQEYNMPENSNNLTYTNAVTKTQLSASSGKYKIISINSVSIEGQFYADLYDPTGNNKETKTYREGYFKVDL